MSTITNTGSFGDTVARIQKTIDDAMKEAQSALMVEFQEVFKRHPDIKLITWCQYTPYFNDGDTCEFQVHDPYASNSMACNHYGEEDDDYEDEDEEESDAAAPEFQAWSAYNCQSSPSKRDVGELLKFMTSPVGEQVLQFAFGDHVEVRVTKDGVDVNDYDHD